jgi:hypothetical protein
MELLNSVYQFLTDKAISIPVAQVVLFVFINSLCILFGRHRLGLLVSYCFVLYWGFFVNSELFMESLGETPVGIPIFAFAGIGMLCLAILGMFINRSD